MKWPARKAGRVEPSMDALSPTRSVSMPTDARWRGRSHGALRWSIAGGLIGGLLALLAFAPASWLAHKLAEASGDHLLITDTRGSVWNGSGVLVLTGGPESRDASALPGRIHWTMGMQGLGLLLRARQDCCINGDLQLHIAPGWGRVSITLDNRNDWLTRFPAAWAAGLGTPWNTVQLGGSVRMLARDFKLEEVQGQWRQFGQLDLDLVNISSRVSPISPLGSYRFSVSGGDAAHPEKAGSVSTMTLSTVEGSLQLSGQGSFGGEGKARFLGEATAAPGREAALNNLLNIIGRRQGARSVISIG